MRSALLGAVVAVTVIVTSLTFASSLNALVSQPPLYGWNWNYALLAGFSAAENLPAAQTAALLDDDPDVAHWAPAYFESVDLNGQSVPALAMSPGAAGEPLHALRTCAGGGVSDRVGSRNAGVAA